MEEKKCGIGIQWNVTVKVNKLDLYVSLRMKFKNTILTNKAG